MAANNVLPLWTKVVQVASRAFVECGNFSFQSPEGTEHNSHSRDTMQVSGYIYICILNYEVLGFG